MERIAPPDEQIAIRRGWAQQYNSGQIATTSMTIPAGKASGVARLRLARLLTNAESDGLAAQMQSAFPWVNTIRLLADAEVPTLIPGADPENIGRQWRFVIEHRASTGRRTYTATMRHNCEPGQIVCAALLVTDQELSLQAGLAMATGISQQWPIILEIETCGLIELPDDGFVYSISASARLRCEEIIIPDPVIEPIP